MKGKLVILSGPSGVGKDTVLHAWREANPRVVRVIAYTTRCPRTGEVDGVDYHFVSKSAFERLVTQGAFLEYKKVYENYYATPLEDMEALLAAGKIAVLKIDVQGAKDVMRLRPDAITIFLLPPSIEELEERIRSRASDTNEEIQTRLASAKAELSESHLYQHSVVNDEINRAVSELERIVS